jgi:hypothetical protein
LFGLFAILNFEGLVFDVIGFAIEAVQPHSSKKNGLDSVNGTRAKSQLDISVGGESITAFLNQYLEVPYDWGAGLPVYITFLSVSELAYSLIQYVGTGGWIS